MGFSLYPSTYLPEAVVTPKASRQTPRCIMHINCRMKKLLEVVELAAAAAAQVYLSFRVNLRLGKVGSERTSCSSSRPLGT